jgi:hypothetical protein
MQNMTGQETARAERVRIGEGGTGQERVEHYRAGNGMREVVRKGKGMRKRTKQCRSGSGRIGRSKKGCDSRL